jgi:hypothetical protein
MNLTKEEEQLIRNNYKAISDLTRLTQMVSGNDSLDGRSKIGRAIRKFMVEQGLNYETSSYQKIDDIILTDEEKEFLDSHAGQNMSSIQLAELLWPDREIKKLSKEQRVVADYVKNHHPDFVRTDENALGIKYSPPKAMSRSIKKINDFAGKDLNESKLQMQDKKCAETLMGSLSSPRFLQVINNYTAQEDRELFEAEFVRCVWDKPDLTSDEINLYINVCMDYINLKHIEHQKAKLNSMFDEAQDQQEFTIRLTEILKTKSEEYNQCASRMDKLITKLNGDRAKRVASRNEQTASVLNIVQLFQEEEQRAIMVKMAEMQKQIIKKEADELETMSDWKSRVLGVRREDVI